MISEDLKIIDTRCHKI